MSSKRERERAREEERERNAGCLCSAPLLRAAPLRYSARSSPPSASASTLLSFVPLRFLLSASASTLRFQPHIHPSSAASPCSLLRSFPHAPSLTSVGLHSSPPISCPPLSASTLCSFMQLRSLATGVLLPPSSSAGPHLHSQPHLSAREEERERKGEQQESQTDQGHPQSKPESDRH